MKNFILFSQRILLLLLLINTAIATPRQHLIADFVSFNPAAVAKIDHSAWQQFLDKYLSKDQHRYYSINYISVTGEDRQRLQDYLSYLQHLDIAQYSRDQQMAFWINLYNAMTVNIILTHYPVNSILDIKLSAGIFSHGPWGAKVIQINHHKLSLDDIEHGILRPIWHDPRIHFALNCGAIGCPNLQPHAFDADHLQLLLDSGASTYINSHRGVIIHEDKLYTSKIFQWYQSDFGHDDKAVIKFITAFASPTLKKQLHDIDTITGTYYNWALNKT